MITGRFVNPRNPFSPLSRTLTVNSSGRFAVFHALRVACSKLFPFSMIDFTREPRFLCYIDCFSPERYGCCSLDIPYQTSGQGQGTTLDWFTQRVLPFWDSSSQYLVGRHCSHSNFAEGQNRNDPLGQTPVWLPTGAGNGIRTRDPCHGKAVLYH